MDKRDYPEEALREALLNALIHRDYSYSASILVSVFDDRMEFVNIGGLVRGISYDDLMLGVSIPRNKHIADVFYRLHYIEAFGTGITKMKEGYIGETVQPKIEVSSNAFKITLPNRNYKGKAGVLQSQSQNCDSISPRCQMILELAGKSEYIVRKDVEELLQVSQATAILVLKEMLDTGLLKKKRCGKQVRYYI